MLGCMDASQAIADLKEISPQVRDVVVIGSDGSVVGSNAADDAAATLADGARRLVDAADEMRPGLAQLEAATVAGSVFVVRDGERMIAATTTPEPTVGLVFYDLKTCLRSVDEEKPKRKRAPAKKRSEDDAAA
jgi:predicted regulator of Ras-like GTPase activity (Roadblock/LC7/MglB family)